MYASGLLALLLSSTLSTTPARTAPMPEATPPSRAAATEIVLEVVERSSGSPSSFGLVVPLDGSVEAWIDRGDDPRRCEVVAAQTRDSVLVKLACSGSPDRALRVEATRPLTPGKRTRIAEITRPGGGKSQVFVTLQ